MNKIHYAGNKFDQKQLYAAIKCVTQNWWALGDKGLQFQKQFSKVVNKKYSVFVNSGSSANMLAIYYAKKLGYTKVITPICGFPTTINPIFQFGLQPIFVDIDKETLNIDIDGLTNAARNNPDSVLIFAHAFGVPANMKQINKIVKQYNLYLIQDCCDALDSTYGWNTSNVTNNYEMLYTDVVYNEKIVGSWSKISTYSFYPAHHISTGQGGMLSTNDYKTYKTLVSFRDWGRDCICRGKKDSLESNGRCNNRYNNWLPGALDMQWDHKYTYSQIGFNLKPLELQAVIGLQQLKKMQQFKETRRINSDVLFDLMQEYQHIIYNPKNKKTLGQHSLFCFPITLKKNCPFTRQQIVKFFQSNGIQTRMYFGGLILYQPAYTQYVESQYNGNYDEIRKLFPQADYVTRNTFFVGVSQILNIDDMNYIKDVFYKFLKSRILDNN